MVPCRPPPHGEPSRLQFRERLFVRARLGVDHLPRAVDSRAVDGRLGREPSSRTPAATPTRAVRSRVPPAAPIASTGPSPSSAMLGAIMLCIRAPGSSTPTSRSVSPSMLFRCRSRPGSQSPEPRPEARRQHADAAVGVDGDKVGRVGFRARRRRERVDQRERPVRLVEAVKPREPFEGGRDSR